MLTEFNDMSLSEYDITIHYSVVSIRLSTTDVVYSSLYTHVELSGQSFTYAICCYRKVIISYEWYVRVLHLSYYRSL